MLCLARDTVRRIYIIGDFRKKADILVTSPCLSVVIPVFNEENTLARVVERVVGVPHLLEIAMVQDTDLEYDPAESHLLRAPGESPDASRFNLVGA